jgi:hypothetical protein
MGMARPVYAPGWGEFTENATFWATYSDDHAEAEITNATAKRLQTLPFTLSSAQRSSSSQWRSYSFGEKRPLLPQVGRIRGFHRCAFWILDSGKLDTS